MQYIHAIIEKKEEKMEDTSALMNTEEALQPMLQLAKESANSTVGMIRTIVLKVLSDPKIFAGFDEIKQILQPKLSSSGAEGEPILRTLDLFSYGTYQDYKKGASSGPYLPLTDSQLLKLRQLTILTSVQQACSIPESLGKGARGGCVVPYQTLAQELGFTEDGNVVDESVVRKVEDVVLSCIYARVLAGQLCQKTGALVVTSRNGPPCRPRDVPLPHGASMLETLKQFHQGRLHQARSTQEQRQQAVQMQLDASRQYLRSVLDRKKKAEVNSAGNATFAAGKSGGLMGWSDGAQPQERRLSELGSSGRRQSKRTRGSVSGGLEPPYRY